MAEPVTIGITATGGKIGILPSMANRHGLIAGATGTGKTVTLQLLAESFSRLGVPVFTADIKGDLSGIARPGTLTPKLEARLSALGIAGFEPRACPVVLWDIFGKSGHPARATISEMGPLLLGRLLELSDVQLDVLQLAFKIADDQGLLLLDLKDLRSLLTWISENSSSLKGEYGNIASSTVATIQRGLIALGEAGGETFFGEPALSLQHLMQRDFSGNGVVSVIDGSSVNTDPRIYSTFLLWLLSELFEKLDEVGDAELPRLVFFFDEAHLLFKDTPKSLVQKIEQVVRLIRSKGVGIYFITQSPLDIPESVLGQLGNRVQHALRAFTPIDQKAVRVAAQTFCVNPAIDAEKVITELGVGEALVSVLDAGGKPTPVERVTVCPPSSRMGPLQPAERTEIVSRSPLAGVYDKSVDRESAYELLKKREAERHAAEPPPAAPGRRGDSLTEALMKSVTRAVGSSVGRALVRGLLGGILGGALARKSSSRKSY